jgi:hypothetical protein
VSVYACSSGKMVDASHSSLYDFPGHFCETCVYGWTYSSSSIISILMIPKDLTAGIINVNNEIVVKA